jgi:hypothetical protein
LFDPYQRRIGAELDAPARRAQPTMLVSLHSFTPGHRRRLRPHAALAGGAGAAARAPQLQGSWGHPREEAERCGRPALPH